MGLRFPAQVHGTCFFVTTTFRDWQELGDIDRVYSALTESLKFCLNKYQALLPGFVLMPSHVHLLIVIEGGELANLMRDFKKYTAQKALKDCGITADQIWMPRYDRVAIYTEAVFRQKLEYIHDNPMKSGLVDIAEEWKWSSASAYTSNESGPLPVWKEW